MGRTYTRRRLGGEEKQSSRGRDNVSQGFLTGLEWMVAMRFIKIFPDRFFIINWQMNVLFRGWRVTPQTLCAVSVWTTTVRQGGGLDDRDLGIYHSVVIRLAVNCVTRRWPVECKGSDLIPAGCWFVVWLLDPRSIRSNGNFIVSVRN